MELEERKKKIKEQQKKLRERDLNDIRKVLDIAEGRRLLWRILTDLGDNFTNSFTGTRATDFNLGKQSVSQTIFRDVIEAKPEAFLQMHREYKSDAERRKNEIPPDEDD